MYIQTKQSLSRNKLLMDELPSTNLDDLYLQRIRTRRSNSYPGFKADFEFYKRDQLQSDICSIRKSVLRISLKVKQNILPDEGEHLKFSAQSNELKQYPCNVSHHDFSVDICEIKKQLSEMHTCFSYKRTGDRNMSKIPKQESNYCQKLDNQKDLKPRSKIVDSLLMLQCFPRFVHSIYPVSLTSYFKSLSSGSSISPEEYMSNEMLRIASYCNFPSNVNVFTSLMSKSGFYFTGESDKVKCYSCGVTYQNWKSGDDPVEIHRKLSPLCHHICTLNITNDVTSASSSYSNQTSRGIENGCIYPNYPSVCHSVPTNNETTNFASGNGTITSSHSFVSGIISNKETNNSTISSHDSSCNGQFSSTTCSNWNVKPNDDSDKNVSNLTSPNDIQNNIISTPYLRMESFGASSSNVRTQTKNSSTDECTRNGTSGSFQTSSAKYSSGDVPIRTTNDISNLGVILDKPRYPSYAPISVRISSFQGWPGYLDQTPKQMASAGFLYAGYNDYTRCFFCGGGLRNWEAGDDPWVEHARWFPNCAYVRQNKDDVFINTVQKKHEQQQSNESSAEGISTQNSHVPSRSSSNPLETTAARSALEMGYSYQQVLEALGHLRNRNPDGCAVSATDILEILLNENTGPSSAETIPANDPANVEHSRNTKVVSNLPNIQHKFNSTDLDETETLRLVEEYRQLKDQRLCKVCLDYDASIAFLPCGHLVCCKDCAPAMRKCPICRGFVKGTVKTFLV